MEQSCSSSSAARSVDYTARSTESVLARLHFVVRVPVSRRGAPSRDVDVEALEAELVDAARTWADDLAEALAARHGDEARPDVARCRPTPSRRPTRRTSRRAAPSPTCARLDGAGRRRAGPAAVEPAGAAAGRAAVQASTAWAAAAAVRGAAGAAAPGRRGRRRAALRDRPDGAAPTWIYDFGLAVPRRRAAAAAHAARALPERVGAVWRGEAEYDGFNALVLLAGLTWRQVMVMRAYVKYLRQAGLPFSQDYVEPALVAHPAIARGWSRCSRRASTPTGRAGDATSRAGRAGRGAARGARRGRASTRTASSARSSAPSPPPCAPTYYASPTAATLRWRSSSTRRRSPTCPRRGRRTRSGSTRRGSRACTCASARSPAAGCAGPTGARTSAPRSSAWSRRRWSRTP